MIQIENARIDIGATQLLGQDGKSIRRIIGVPATARRIVTENAGIRVGRVDEEDAPD